MPCAHRRDGRCHSDPPSGEETPSSGTGFTTPSQRWAGTKDPVPKFTNELSEGETKAIAKPSEDEMERSTTSNREETVVPQDARTVQKILQSMVGTENGRRHAAGGKNGNEGTDG